VKTLMPSLAAEPPALDGYPLTRVQADTLSGMLGHLRDVGALGQLKRCLNLTALAYQGKLSYATGASNPMAPIGEGAFDCLARALTGYVRGAASSPDGKLGFDDLVQQLQSDLWPFSQAVAERLNSLKSTTPSWGGVVVTPDAAIYLRTTLEQHLRSSMTLDNLDRAVTLIATARGGQLDATGAATLQQVVSDYLAFYPGRRLLDFNKLERLAKCKVEGKPYPCFTVNGQAVGLAEFYATTADAVRTSFAQGPQTLPWYADRWGFRARGAIELLDVIAEQAARHEGPVALLQDRNPGCSVEVQVTGRDGDHEQFIYVVKKQGAVVDYFTQGSEGTVAAYRKVTTPILMTASISPEGGLSVTVPKPLVTTRYPLQQTYSIGDSIDYPYYDQAAAESQTEGSAFSTRYKILEAKITGFTADGNYTVAYTLPDGQARTGSLTLNEIRKANNPHVFPVGGASYIDVSIDVDTDASLKAFLDGAQPIIDKYLPTDGSILSLSPADLEERQLACREALRLYCGERMTYPAEPEAHPDEAAKQFWALMETLKWGGTVPFGELLDLGRGVCRHQDIAGHLLCQIAGIDSRLAEGAANTDANMFRGLHIWQELTLATGRRYLSDQTWYDTGIPLWNGAYNIDARRTEMYNRTAAYDPYIVNPS